MNLNSEAIWYVNVYEIHFLYFCWISFDSRNFIFVPKDFLWNKKYISSTFVVAVVKYVAHSNMCLKMTFNFFLFLFHKGFKSNVVQVWYVFVWVNASKFRSKKSSHAISWMVIAFICTHLIVYQSLMHIFRFIEK